MRRICVFCGSSYGAKKEYKHMAVKLGTSLASQNIDLIYGGGNVGLMGILADSVINNGGHVIGVIPKHLADKEVAHRGISDLRIVNTMHERKALMEKLCDAFITLPGGFGTLEEIFEAITWAQLNLHSKPCGFLNIKGFYDQLFEFIDHVINEEFICKEYRSIIQVDSNPEKLIEKLKNYTPPILDKAKHALLIKSMNSIKDHE